jgi:hypothetical protein
MSVVRDVLRPSREMSRMGLHLPYADRKSKVIGEVFFDMRDAKTNTVLFTDYRKNVITYDASILVAILTRDPTSRTNGINMLGVGTGATGAILSPDAPDPRQRKLNGEIARKPFSSTTFRDGSGNAVAIPTNIVDYTCTLSESEAVGPLNELGLLSTISNNPLVLNPNPDAFPTRDTTVDLSLYDILFSYLTFAVISKPSTATLAITYRITY